MDRQYTKITERWLQIMEIIIKLDPEEASRYAFEKIRRNGKRGEGARLQSAARRQTSMKIMWKAILISRDAIHQSGRNTWAPETVAQLHHDYS